MFLVNRVLSTILLKNSTRLGQIKGSVKSFYSIQLCLIQNMQVISQANTVVRNYFTVLRIHLSSSIFHSSLYPFTTVYSVIKELVSVFFNNLFVFQVKSYLTLCGYWFYLTCFIKWPKTESKQSLGLLTTLLERQNGGMEKVRKTERRQLPALLLKCLFSEKCSPSCTSTMPAQNDRGYCTPNHCVVGRERERNWGRERIDVKFNSSETEIAREREREREIVREALQGP